MPGFRASGLSRTQRLSKLGKTLAVEAMKTSGFRLGENLGTASRNHSFELLVEERGTRYLVAVRPRNETRDTGNTNESYNIITIDQKRNNQFKSQGKSPDEITRILFNEIQASAKIAKAIPAWIVVPMRPWENSYAVFFGVLDQLAGKRSLPMMASDRRQYRCLVDWRRDDRITEDLSNQ